MVNPSLARNGRIWIYFILSTKGAVEVYNAGRLDKIVTSASLVLPIMFHMISMNLQDCAGNVIEVGDNVALASLRGNKQTVPSILTGDVVEIMADGGFGEPGIKIKLDKRSASILGPGLNANAYIVTNMERVLVIHGDD